MCMFLFLTDFGSGLLSRDFIFDSMSGPLVCESIDIIDDDNFEGTETFSARISASSPSSGTLEITMETAEITITDRGGKYKIQAIHADSQLVGSAVIIMVFEILAELV